MDQEYEVNENELAEEVGAEPVPVEPQPETVQKKVSPFADAPYEMEPLPEPQEQPAPEETASEPEEAPAQEPAAPKAAVSKKQGLGMRIVAALLAVVVVAASSGITAFLVSNGWKTRTDRLEKSLTAMQNKIKDLQQEIRDNSFTGNGNSVSGTPNTSPDGLTPGQVYAKAYKSVVSISCSDTGFGGSGFILAPEGVIVTNYHVIEGSSRISVTTYNEKVYAAAVVGFDAANDIAVLKVDATGLDAVTLGSSDDLIVGDQVVAIGHPLGIETATLTVGYISAKDQSIDTEGAVINMLQTDAAINSGNSGGPLFNMKGEVVGITTAKYSGSTDSGAIIESIGFAIPVDDVAQKIRDLMNFGYVTGAYLGISVTDMDSSVLDAFGFPRGAYVVETVPGYCAAKAGIRAKDMIIAIGDYKVDGVNSLSRILQKFKAGDTTTVTVWRAGAEITLNITLDEKPIPTP